MSLETALYALMVSGNDAGIAIAKSVGAYVGRRRDGLRYVHRRDERESRSIWGMSHSVYTKPHGLDFDAWR